MKKLFFILIYLPVIAYSQDTNPLDSLNFEKARYYFLKREYSDALPLFLKVDSISKKNNLKNETLVLSILDRAEISRVTFTHKGVEQAGKLMYEALELAKDIESDELIYLVYKYLADLESLKGDFDSSKKYLDLAFAYYRPKDDVIRIGQLYALYINLYNSTDQLDKSEQANKDRIAYLK